MNTLLSWCRCIPEIPEPDHSQTFPRWTFRNGTVVNAYFLQEAIRILTTTQTKNFWACEVEPGVWDVYFDDNVCVEQIHSETLSDAVKYARWFLEIDARDQKLNIETEP